METRLSRICDAIIEAGWLAALIVTPLFFNTFSNRVFEPDKLHLLRSIALVMAVAWLVQLLDSGFRRQPGGPGLWSRLRATPLVLPTLVLVISYLLSTALSVVPRISFFGSYVRMQGTFTLPELRRHFRHGPDAPAQPRPGQPHLLHGHPDQPAHHASTASCRTPGSTRCPGAAM